ncbi:MAG: hypothetical protein MAG715_00672 [Methanonatronarchaeales archaeon]|nr:hypothetical protein [Methanonatronarchaeales archaeon]
MVVSGGATDRGIDRTQESRGEGGVLSHLLDDRYLLTAVAILLFAASLRLYSLNERMFHYDEGQVLYFVHLAAERGAWSYSPALHGPLMFHAGSLILSYLGDAEFLFRLPAVAFGIGTVSTPFLLRDELGDRASAFAAVLLATSPLFLYYTRFYRSDPALLFFSSVALVSAAAFVRTRRSRYIVALGIAAGFAATTKENFPLEIGMSFLFLMLFLSLSARVNGTGPGELARAFLRRVPWLLLASLLAYVIFVALYAPRPVEPSRLPGTPLTVLSTALEYWSGHSGGDVPFLPFYAALLLVAEPLILVAGLTGAYLGLRDGSRFHGFLAAWVVIDLVAYSVVADGRMPWLGIYGLYPLALLAGTGLDRLVRVWRESDRATGRALLLAGVLLLSGHGVQAAGSNYVWYDDAAGIFDLDPYPGYDGSMIVQWGQPDREVREILETLRSQAEERHGSLWRDLRIQVVSGDKLMHPMQWYLREYRDVEYVDEPRGDPPVVMVPGYPRDELAVELEGYRVMEGRITPGDPLTLYYRPVRDTTG